MKIKCYRNFFGKISFIYLKKLNCTFENIKKLMNLFDTEYLLLSITALDVDSEFFLSISNNKELFRILMPVKNNITAETIIAAKRREILFILDFLVKTDIRSISIYGIKSQAEIKDDSFLLNFSNSNADKLIDSGLENCAVDVVMEENLVIVTFNSKIINATEMVQRIKGMF